MTDLSEGTTTNHIEKIAQEIKDSFVWSSTPQGATYWNNVYDNLRYIADEIRYCRHCGKEITLHLGKWFHFDTVSPDCGLVATP